ncbi:glycoside hydrolase superfamily [Mycena rosella]|uniref:Alpha-galactosidase n=1 Tax=Mycena rosella TaxID=1033263 RepID=A0AAD7E0P4_MYCRO|nr:glycoside hydrolase superfamily [Mycena rosella]
MLFPFLTLVLLAVASQTLAQAGPFAQCGGNGWTGSTSCVAGWQCVAQNAFYSQCLQQTVSTTSAPTSSSPTSTTTKTTTSSTITSCGILSATKSCSATLTVTGFPASAPTTPPSNLVGKTPALGWNSWNAYACSINETKVVAAANQFISLGLKTAGYQYINIDDCWSVMARNSTTNQIVPDPTKFPNGISGVATQVHALGLKFGIYSDAGTATCAGFPGSLGFESIDAATFNAWGVDYLKYGMSMNSVRNSNSAIRYRQMTAALAAQARPVQFNLCLWGNYDVWDWGARVGHSWRLSGDSSATWSYITSIISTAVQHLSNDTFGGHGDMDMMEIGNGALTIQEQRTHFAAWIMLKSPILLGTDLSLLNSTQLTIIKNAELLAFHQDLTIGAPAAPFTPFASAPTTSPPEYYSGKSSKGTHVFIINTAATAATKTFTFSQIPGLGASGSFSVHDMWAGADLSGTYTASATFSVTVQPHDTVAYFINVL